MDDERRFAASLDSYQDRSLSHREVMARLERDGFRPEAELYAMVRQYDDVVNKKIGDAVARPLRDLLALKQSTKRLLACANSVREQRAILESAISELRRSTS
jgi:hypothetical protein